jgi:hypothetical protein
MENDLEGTFRSRSAEAAAADDSADDDDSANGAAAAAPAEARPLSPEDAVFKKAIELLKTPAKKAA